MNISIFAGNLVQRLLEQLHEFGLNPREWALEGKGADRVHLVNRKDAGFRFVGAVDARRGVWKSLRLESL